MGKTKPLQSKTSSLFEVARVLVRRNHVAGFIVHTDHRVMLTAVELRVVDCVADCVWLGVPQATEWLRIGDKVDAAMIFARAHLISVHHLGA